jgi:hypothetical protein
LRLLLLFKSPGSEQCAREQEDEEGVQGVEREVGEVKADGAAPPDRAVQIEAQNEDRAEEAPLLPPPGEGQTAFEHPADQLEIVREKERVDDVRVGGEPHGEVKNEGQGGRGKTVKGQTG